MFDVCECKCDSMQRKSCEVIAFDFVTGIECVFDKVIKEELDIEIWRLWKIMVLIVKGVQEEEEEEQEDDDEDNAEAILEEKKNSFSQK